LVGKTFKNNLIKLNPEQNEIEVEEIVEKVLYSLVLQNGIDAIKDFYLWVNDVQKVSAYIEENKCSIYSGYYSIEQLDNLTVKIIKQAVELINEIINTANNKTPYFLENIFENLERLNNEKEPIRQKAKNKVNPRMVRVYGLKLDDGCYFITGCALKFVRKINDDEKLITQLKTLNAVKEILIKQQIFNFKGLKEFLKK
jgi:archaellum component FlaC